MKIKKITKKQALALMEKEKSGKKLSQKENLNLLLYIGYSEKTAREMLYVTSKNYSKPDKNGIIKIV